MKVLTLLAAVAGMLVAESAAAAKLGVSMKDSPDVSFRETSVAQDRRGPSCWGSSTGRGRSSGR